MDYYLFSMCLAEDIVKCVLKSHGIKWEASNSIRSIYKRKLPERIVILFLEKAIVKLIEVQEKKFKNILRDYRDNNWPTVQAFCLYTIEFGSEIFKNGFDPCVFISYSAIVADMAYGLYELCPDIPEHCAGVIGTVLVSQIMTGQFEESGGQEGLKEASYRMLEDMSKKVIKSPKNATTSF